MHREKGKHFFSLKVNPKKYVTLCHLKVRKNYHNKVLLLCWTLKKKIYSRSSNKVRKLMGVGVGEIDSLPRPLTVWNLHVHPPHLRGFSPGSLVSSHIPKMYTLGKLVCLYYTRLSALWGGRGVCVSASCDGRASCPGLVLPAALSSQDRLPPTTTLNWNKQVGI